MARAFRRAVAFGLWAVAGLAVGLVAAASVPALFGVTSMRVLSGSMEPALSTGDVVIVEPIAPIEARVGDVVSFRDPEDAGRIVTHRVHSIQVRGTTVGFVTRGDANTAVERWWVPADGEIGLVRYRIPRLGYVLGWLGGPAARIGLVVVPALALGLVELRRIWRRAPEPVTGAPGAAA